MDFSSSKLDDLVVLCCSWNFMWDVCNRVIFQIPWDGFWNKRRFVSNFAIAYNPQGMTEYYWIDNIPWWIFEWMGYGHFIMFRVLYQSVGINVSWLKVFGNFQFNEYFDFCIRKLRYTLTTSRCKYYCNFKDESILSEHIH